MLKNSLVFRSIFISLVVFGNLLVSICSNESPYVKYVDPALSIGSVHYTSVTSPARPKNITENKERIKVRFAGGDWGFLLCTPFADSVNNELAGCIFKTNVISCIFSNSSFILKQRGPPLANTLS